MVMGFLMSRCILVPFGWAAKAPSNPGGGIIISMEGVDLPANDLIYQGRRVEPDFLVDLQHRTGLDVSRLDPEQILNNEQGVSLWSSKELPPFEPDLDKKFPKDGEVLYFHSLMSSARGVFRARVQDRSGGHEPKMHHLIVSRSIHGALIRAAALRKLGYSVESPKYYKKITLKFNGAKQKEEFLMALQDPHSGAAGNQDRWVDAGDPINNKEDMIVLNDVVLDQFRELRKNNHHFHWQLLADYTTFEGSTLAGSRAIRALVVPLVMLDVDEDINAFSWEMTHVQDKKLYLRHPSAGAFSECTRDDYKWIARKIGQWPREFFKEIVSKSGLPEDIQAVVLEKIIARRNEALSRFNIHKELDKSLREFKVDMKITLGSVQDGQVTELKYPGHCEDFAGVNEESKLTFSEIFRYTRMEFYTGLLRRAVEEINKAISIKTNSDVANQAFKSFQEDIYKKFLEHIQKNPNQPFVVPVKPFIGPTGGVNLILEHKVISGPYFGSSGNESKVQIVDNFGIQASLGFFGGLSGLSKVLPFASGNILLQRNWIRVRPVADMKEALEQKWENALVFEYFRSLAKLLSEDEDEVSTDPDASEPPPKKSTKDRIKEFTDKMKDGEIFIMTESVLPGIQGSAVIPIFPLINVGSIGINPTLTVGVGADAMLLRRTTILKGKAKEDGGYGFQVYLQRAKGLGVSNTFDFNWWMNIARNKNRARWSEGYSEGYLIDREKITPEKENAFALIMKGLFYSNNSEYLKKKQKEFKNVEFIHKLTSKVTDLKFLRWTYRVLNERHLIRIIPQDDPKKRCPDKGAVCPPAVNDQRIVYRSTHSVIQGTSELSFLSEIIRALTDQFLGTEITLFPDVGGGDPADSFFGKSYRKTIMASAEVTPSLPNGPGSQDPRLELKPSDPVAQIDRSWLGWTMGPKALYKLLDHLDSHLRRFNSGLPLVRRGIFNNLDRLEGFKISSTLRIGQKGIKKLSEEFFGAGLFDILTRMIEIEGKEKFEAYCSRSEFRHENSSDLDLYFTPYDRRTIHLNGYLSTERDGQVAIPCLKSWMQDIFIMREKYQKADIIAQVIMSEELIRVLDKKLGEADLMQRLGFDNFWFQIRIDGIKVGMERDGNREDLIKRSMLGDSLGTLGTPQDIDVFGRIANQEGFMTHELFGRYLGAEGI